MYFYRKIEHYSSNSFVMIPNSTMPSGHSMNISTYILGCMNAASMSHSSETHPSSSWYKVSPIRIVVFVSDVTVDNESMKSNPGTCKYPLTTFIYFRKINMSGSSLLLKTHFSGTGFIPFAFMTLIFIVIHAFLDRKLFTSEIAEIFHKCPF